MGNVSNLNSIFYILFCTKLPPYFTIFNSLFDPLTRNFVSAGLSPNPPLKRGRLSPEVGMALIQDKCVYFG
jgi:hypothetical protein